MTVRVRALQFACNLKCAAFRGDIETFCAFDKFLMLSNNGQ